MEGDEGWRWLMRRGEGGVWLLLLLVEAKQARGGCGGTRGMRGRDEGEGIR